MEQLTIKMTWLITKQTVSGLLQTAVGYSAADFDNVFIREAQEFDLKPLVCEEFYCDLLSKQGENAWRKLVHGGNYRYDDRMLSFAGIAKVLAYFAYARFILKGNIVSTSHGFAMKKTPHSELLSLAERKSFYHSYRKDANIVFEEVKKFIARNSSDYPSWKCNSKAKGAFKTIIIQ